TSRATFERVIGHPPSGLADPRPTKLVPKSLQEALEIALRENPNVVGALYREQAARFAIETIRGELLPTVQVEANYGKSFDT
ncbi:TolC family protein, partial [Acinetobacter baumannii]